MSSHFFKRNQATATLPTEPVSGIVTLDGQPVADATVIFTPVQVSKDTFSATGITDAQGKYSLKTDFSPSVTSDGAVAGEYAVTVTKSNKSASDAPKSGPSPEDMAKMMSGNKERGGRRTGGNRGTTDSALPPKYASSSASGITFKVPGSSFDTKMTK